MGHSCESRNLVWRSGSSSENTGGEGLSGVSPFKGLGSVLVVVMDKLLNSFFKFFKIFKRAAFQNSSGQNREPNFNLIQPRSMDRQKMKHHSFVLFRQNSFSFLFRHFVPTQATEISDVFSDFFGRMRFEIIENDMDFFARVFFTIQQIFQKTQKLLRSLPLEAFPKHFSSVRIQRSEQRTSSMPSVVKLSARDVSLFHGIVWKEPLERLNSRLFVNTEDRASRWGFQVQADDVEHLSFKVGIGGVKPVFELPGLQSSLFQPSMNRANRNAGDNLLFNRRANKLSESPNIKGASRITRRVQDQFNELVFLLRGKKNSELRFGEDHSALRDDLRETVFAISPRYWDGLQAALQFDYFSNPPLREEWFWPEESRDEAAYNNELYAANSSLLPRSTQSKWYDVLALESPPFSNTIYRPISHSNLANSVLVLRQV